MTHTCKTGILKNSPSNPYKIKETAERLNFEKLHGFNSFPNTPF